jgi:hypothetical protein
MKGMTMLRILMLPANAVCDAVGLTDENERGMMRMLVNMLLFSAIAVVVFLIIWRIVVRG